MGLAKLAPTDSSWQSAWRDREGTVVGDTWMERIGECTPRAYGVHSKPRAGGWVCGAGVRRLTVRSSFG